jgi:hypothetical protein
MDHIVYLDAQAKEMEKLLAGKKVMMIHRPKSKSSAGQANVILSWWKLLMWKKYHPFTLTRANIAIWMTGLQ